VLAWLGSEQGIVATPHSQRSKAEVRARLARTGAQADPAPFATPWRAWRAARTAR
jgi:hypothetical protein